jgi:hypothetical protein
VSAPGEAASAAGHASIRAAFVAAGRADARSHERDASVASAWVARTSCALPASPSQPRAVRLDPLLPSPRSSTLDQWLLHDSMQAQMLDPDFASDTVRFVELQVGVVWSWCVGGVCGGGGERGEGLGLAAPPTQPRSLSQGAADAPGGCLPLWLAIDPVCPPCAVCIAPRRRAGCWACWRVAPRLPRRPLPPSPRAWCATWRPG